MAIFNIFDIFEFLKQNFDDFDMFLQNSIDIKKLTLFDTSQFLNYFTRFLISLTIFHKGQYFEQNFTPAFWCVTLTF